MDWRHRSACRDEDPELFFPVGEQGPALTQVAEAKTVCVRCPVLDECLSWGLETGQEFGVWGGLSEGERRAMGAARARMSTDLDDKPKRVCKRCEQLKPLSEFGKDRHMTDGISTRCKLCKSALTGAYQRRIRQAVAS